MRYLKLYNDYLKENKEYLSYDEIDLDIFLRRYIVGRHFSSEKEGKEYLNKVLNKDDKQRNIDDFVLVDQHNGTLLPYKIYPKPSQKELNRNKASEYISKYGWVKGSYPMYAYIEYKHIDKIKELGVKYDFKPLKELNLNDILSSYLKGIKVKDLSFLVVKEDYNKYGGTMIEGFLNSKSKKECISIKNELENKINKFNSIIGSDFFIKDFKLRMTSESKNKKIKNYLDDDEHSKYNPNDSINDDKYRYEKIVIFLERGNDEDEYLAVIEMESLDKPKIL